MWVIVLAALSIIVGLVFVEWATMPEYCDSEEESADV